MRLPELTMIWSWISWRLKLHSVDVQVVLSTWLIWVGSMSWLHLHPEVMYGVAPGCTASEAHMSCITVGGMMITLFAVAGVAAFVAGMLAAKKDFQLYKDEVLRSGEVLTQEELEAGGQHTLLADVEAPEKAATCLRRTERRLT